MKQEKVSQVSSAIYFILFYFILFQFICVFISFYFIFYFYQAILNIASQLLQTLILNIT